MGLILVHFFVNLPAGLVLLTEGCITSFQKWNSVENILGSTRVPQLKINGVAKNSGRTEGGSNFPDRME